MNISHIDDINSLDTDKYYVVDPVTNEVKDITD